MLYIAFNRPRRRDPIRRTETRESLGTPRCSGLDLREPAALPVPAPRPSTGRAVLSHSGRVGMAGEGLGRD